jgi:hypothetical protein
MRFRVARRALLAALLVVGCYSPTLPLPPPVKPDVSVTSTGDYRLKGGVLPNAQVFALDSRTLLIDGQEADATGLYDFVLHRAQAGDSITLWYEAGTDLSPPMVFELPAAAPVESGGGGGMSNGAAGAAAAGGAAGAGG